VTWWLRRPDDDDDEAMPSRSFFSPGLPAPATQQASTIGSLTYTKGRDGSLIEFAADQASIRAIRLGDRNDLWLIEVAVEGEEAVWLQCRAVGKDHAGLRVAFIGATD